MKIAIVGAGIVGSITDINIRYKPQDRLAQRVSSQ